jgi:hypothetical protein
VEEVKRCPACGHIITLSLVKLTESFIPIGGITVDEIKRLVKLERPATDKQIYNAIGFLARKNRVDHMGYGQYRKIVGSR